MGFSIQEIVEAFESDKADGTQNALNALRAQVTGGGQAPAQAPSGGVAVNAPVIDHSTMDHSTMGGAPMQAPGPGGLAGAREILEAPGVFDDLTARQAPPNPDTNLRLGGLERTRQLGLDTALEARDEQFQPGIVDRIAQFGGIGALIAGMAGAGSPRTSRRLRQFGAAGIGFAQGRRQNFRADQDRTFANATAQRNAEFGAESAPLLAMQRQMMGENKAAAANVDLAGDNFNQLLNLDKFGLARDKFGLAEDKFDLSEREFGGKGAVLTTDRAIAPYLARALEKMAAGQPLDEVDLWALDEANKGLSTKATAPNIRLAGRNLEDLRSTQGDIIGRELDILGPSDIDEFPRKRIGSKEFTAGPRDVGRLQDIARRSRTGDLRLPSVRERDFGTMGEGFWGFLGFDKDTLVANRPLEAAADSAITLAGRTRGELIQQDPDYYGVEGVDSTRQLQVSPAQRTPLPGGSGDQVAQAEGFPNAAALWNHLVKLNASGQMSAESLAQAKLELGM